MPKSLNILNKVPEELLSKSLDVTEQIERFVEIFDPLEASSLYLLVDNRTSALFIECHIRASKLLPLSTLDVPIDPEEQSEYRANREISEDHTAFARMKSDAIGGRTFSNLVTEYSDSFDSEHPLKIVGGQHRFIAIKEAFEKGVDEYHGLKVYFSLDADQRLDVQLVSNTNISVSNDLLDRMYETLSGPQLRDWCQKVGLLLEQQDFADKRGRGQPITVRAARTFILNFYLGINVDPKKFDSTKTTPELVKTGGSVVEWEELKKNHPEMWNNPQLKEAGREFAELIDAQRNYFTKRKERVNVDYAEKATNYAVLSAWAFIAGLLTKNPTRLKRHYDLRNKSGKDPLNASILAKGRHKTDPENYRGLGYRTDPKERGRFVELFYAQTERGDGINKRLVDLAIAKYHAKQAMLEVKKLED